MAAHVTQRLRSDESGFGIIEVLISSLLVVVLSVGVLSAVDAAGRTSATNKARGDASNLASQDQDRLRSLPITQLVGSEGNKTTDPVTVDNRNYKVVSTGAYIVGSGEGDSCASTDNAPRYLKMSSTVTWPGMTVSPVRQHSLRAIPNRSTEGLGSLAVDIDNAGGTGVSGIVVTITGTTAGTVTRSASTNANGCVVFGFIPSGKYTVSFNQAGYITADNPGIQSVSEEAVVADNAIASKEFLYDKPGSAAVAYKVGTGSTATTGNGFTVANPGFSGSATRSFSHSESGTANSGAVLFPFAGAYQVWSGRCDVNQPTSNTGTALVPSNGTSSTADAREFQMRFSVQRRTASNNSNTAAVIPTDSKVTLVVSPSVSGCTNTIGKTAATVVGSATANPTVWEVILPWGKYDVCVAYNNSSSNRAKVTATGVSNESVGVSTYGTTLQIPYNQSSGYTC